MFVTDRFGGVDVRAFALDLPVTTPPPTEPPAITVVEYDKVLDCSSSGFKKRITFGCESAEQGSDMHFCTPGEMHVLHYKPNDGV